MCAPIHQFVKCKKARRQRPIPALANRYRDCVSFNAAPVNTTFILSLLDSHRELLVGYFYFCFSRWAWFCRRFFIPFLLLKIDILLFSFAGIHPCCYPPYKKLDQLEWYDVGLVRGRQAGENENNNPIRLSNNVWTWNDTERPNWANPAVIPTHFLRFLPLFLLFACLLNCLVFFSSLGFKWQLTRFVDDVQLVKRSQISSSPWVCVRR